MEWLDSSICAKRFGVSLRHLGMLAAHGKIARRRKPDCTKAKVPWQFVVSEVREYAKQYRNDRGMLPMRSAQRRCMRCLEMFMSVGPQNRLCQDCKIARTSDGRVDDDYVYADGGW